MKKIQRPKWKKRKRGSFQLYFTIVVSFILFASIVAGHLFTELVNDFFVEKLGVPQIIIIVVFCLTIGALISSFVGRFMLAPVKKIRNSMREVSEGNLNITISEDSFFDEVEDINHAFNIMTKELRSTQIIQKDFIASVSHEIKTPLTAIEGYTTMLRDGDITEEEKNEYAEKILFNTQRMSELVNNILLISKLENQGVAVTKEEFFVDEQIRQEIVASENKWAKKDIKFDIDFDSLIFMGSKNLILHVWSNLIDNAIKFSPFGGTITMSLKKHDGFICFSIRDEGDGIKEEDKKYIFDKFYQSDTSHQQEGNGLGLALVKQIIDYYDGKIDVQNINEKGCEFIVRLPVE